MSTMTRAEIETFLQAPRHAILGTNTKDGAPQLSPVWFLHQDGLLYVSATVGTAKVHNLRRDPRISICVDGGRGDARTVMVYGTAQLLEPNHPLQEEMRWRIIRHYHDNEEEARRYHEITKERKAALIIVTPAKVISQDFN